MNQTTQNPVHKDRINDFKSYLATAYDMTNFEIQQLFASLMQSTSSRNPTEMLDEIKSNLVELAENFNYAYSRELGEEFLASMLETISERSFV